MPKLVPLVKSTAFRKGVTGNNSKWLGVWTLIAVAQFARKHLGKEEVRVERIVLKPGQTLEIRDTGVKREALGKR